jgi:hypothetical protein
MRILICVAIAACPLVAVGQERSGESDPNRMRVLVTGCAKGSTLTESNLAPGASETTARRWRLRGSKQLMKQLKAEGGKEVEIAGTTKDPESGLAMGGKRIGKSNVYIGAGPMSSARDPLPDLPTIDVESFKPTGETCR